MIVISSWDPTVFLPDSYEPQKCGQFWYGCCVKKSAGNLTPYIYPIILRILRVLNPNRGENRFWRVAERESGSHELLESPWTCQNFPRLPGSSSATSPELLSLWFLSGTSKPRFCQTYVLQLGAFHENDGNHENDEDNSDSHKQGGWLLDLRRSRKARKWRKPRESRVQNIGSPKARFRKTRFLRATQRFPRKFPKLPQKIPQKLPGISPTNLLKAGRSTSYKHPVLTKFNVSVAIPAEPRGEKIFYFSQNF